MSAIERAVEIRFEESKEESNLKKMLQEYVHVEMATPGTFMKEIRETKNKIEAIDAEKYRGALVHARTEKILADEIPTKRAFATEKYAKRNEIVEVEYKGKMSGILSIPLRSITKSCSSVEYRAGLVMRTISYPLCLN